MDYNTPVKNEKEEKAWRAAGLAAGKLWGVEHPYHCSTANYYSNECKHSWESWAAFFEEFGDADDDYNMPFRWDWNPAGPEWNGCDTPELTIFMMLQRKGIFVSHTIKNIRAEDEPAVHKWLTTRWEYMRKLWAPLSTGILGVSDVR